MATNQPELPMRDVTPARKPAAAAAKKPDPVKTTAAVQKLPKPRAKAETSKAVAITEPKAPAEAKSVLAIIADAATNPNFNPESMRALLDMQKEVMADQAKRDFNAAFIALQADLANVRVTRDGKIEVRKKDASGERSGPVQQATPYATFNSIMRTVQSLLTKHGFALSFATEPVGPLLLVRGFLDGHGHQRTTAFPLPAETSGSKNNVQGWGSSMSYGKRYCTIALLNIVSEDPKDIDTDGHQGNFKPAKGGGFVDVPENVPPITPAQRNQIVDLLTDAKIKEAQFCAKYGIGQIIQLPSNLFDAAVKAIIEHKAARNG
jgi:ERF superfamily